MENRALPIILDDLLSERDCLAVLERADQAGFKFAETRHGRDEEIRSGRKCTLTDGTLSKIAFARLRDATASWRPEVQLDGHSWGAPCAVSELLRVLSYDSGDFFQRHVDAPCDVGDSPLHPKVCRCQTRLKLPPAHYALPSLHHTRSRLLSQIHPAVCCAVPFTPPKFP